MKNPKQENQKKPQTVIQPLHTESDAIAARAYELWVARGCPDGSPEEDWYRAEDLLTKNGDRTPSLAL